jgi:hypothetical protein
MVPLDQSIGPSETLLPLLQNSAISLVEHFSIHEILIELDRKAVQEPKNKGVTFLYSIQ